jgi:hypothetical protein
MGDELSARTQKGGAPEFDESDPEPEPDRPSAAGAGAV